MAQYEDITIDQGADFAFELHLVNKDGNPKDLTDHIVSGVMKRTYAASESVPFSTVISSPLTNGIVTLSLSNTQTDDLKPGKYVFDVELSYDDSDSNTIIERILEGKASVTPSVTK